MVDGREATVKFGLYRQEIQLPVRGSDPAAALRLIGEEQARRAEGTVVRGHSPDRLRAHLAAGRNNQPPAFRGRLQTDGSQVYLTGVIAESATSLILLGIFGFFTVVLGLIAIALLASGAFTEPGLYICLFFALAFGLLGWLLGRVRVASFAVAANQLTERLTTLGRPAI